ncbi:uncharacterized protein LOC113972421 [Neopelma chrysocephalum]|uniref:uncharacterized protein LOC113972421 n=1 Tax=Neopelma chrysocephalum TaxID=114329 RepID=UPI000FCD36B9|nr:uncharacterized protein LOC113972421 [Neopelma chrysocephalum]
MRGQEKRGQALPKMAPPGAVELPVHQFLPVASCTITLHHRAEPGSVLLRDAPFPQPSSLLSAGPELPSPQTRRCPEPRHGAAPLNPCGHDPSRPCEGVSLPRTRGSARPGRGCERDRPRSRQEPPPSDDARPPRDAVRHRLRGPEAAEIGPKTSEAIPFPHGRQGHGKWTSSPGRCRPRPPQHTATAAAVTPPRPGAAGMDAESAGGRDSAAGAGPGGGGGQGDFVSALPPEVSSRIFGGLDVESLCHASSACKGWHRVIEGNGRLWRHHCLAVRAVCRREIDCDRGNDYSWKITLLRKYWKSKVKQEWLSGKYSNIPSQHSLPEKIMYHMDVDTWGEILEAELER